MSKMMKKRWLASALGAALACACVACTQTPGPVPSPASLPAEQPIGQIEPVAYFYDAMPTGVTVSRNGRIFINYPRWGDDVPFTVAELRDGKAVAYPNADVNVYVPAHPGTTLISVQSVVVDALDRLWILDTAAPGLEEPKAGGAKLVAVDLATNKVVKTIVLPASVVLKTTYLNDVRFDLRQGKAGVAYITDSSLSGRPGGLIVVDLATGVAWRRLTGHRSTSPDPAFVPIVEGEIMALRDPGKPPKPLAVAADGIDSRPTERPSTTLPCPAGICILCRPLSCWIVTRTTPRWRPPLSTWEKRAPRTAWRQTLLGASTPATTSTTASASGKRTVSGGPSPTIRGSFGRTRCRWGRTAISISPPTRSTAWRSSTTARTCA